MIEKVKLSLTDKLIHMGGGLLLDEDKTFDITLRQSRFLPYKNMFWNTITYEVSLDRTEYFRKVYGTLDFIRDIGGLFAGIAALFSPIVLLV